MKLDEARTNEEVLNFFLDWTRSELGFMFDKEETFLQIADHFTAEIVVDAIIRADGGDPVYSPWKKELIAEFVWVFGKSRSFVRSDRF